MSLEHDCLIKNVRTMKLPLCTSVHCILESELGWAVKTQTRGWLNVMDTRHEYFCVGSPELGEGKRLVSLDWTAPMFPLVLQKPNQPVLRLVPTVGLVLIDHA